MLDPVGAHLEPGEILVAPSTDPGWTPLFLTAGGLVMEMGGSNSHGAVVAREYGIPAVVGVPDATRKIETGQLVTVDGAAGLVTVEAAEAVTAVPVSTATSPCLPHRVAAYPIEFAAVRDGLTRSVQNRRRGRTGELSEHPSAAKTRSETSSIGPRPSTSTSRPRVR